MKFKIIPNEQTPEWNELIDLDKDKKLLEKFWSFATRQQKCAGLASNQVSMNGARIMKPFFAIKNKSWELIINPEIIKYHGKSEEKIERCLTWIGKKIIVERYPIINVNYTDMRGENHLNMQIEGFEAQVWQHEYNHLIGVEEKFVWKRKYLK